MSEIYIPEINTLFAEIILPLAVGNTFTYRIPLEFMEEAIPGKRVLVPFGKSKIYSGLIYKIHTTAPKEYEARYIHSVIDPEPIILESHMEFWHWIAAYYLCHTGEVMKAALPSGLKLESEHFLVLNEDFEPDSLDLSMRENQILDLLYHKGEIRMEEIARTLGLKTAYASIHSLIQKKCLYIREEISKGYQPKKKAFIRLNPDFDQEEKRKVLFEELEKRPAQLSILLAYYKLHKKPAQDIAKSELLVVSGQNPGILNTLIKKGVFQAIEKRISRLEVFSNETDEAFTLSEAQEIAYQSIKEILRLPKPVLLHGVTSSGKTQVYFRFIQDFLDQGKQVLYLLPEIALTAQLVNRLRKQFGDTVGIYHSQFNENERVETWENTLNQKYSILIGARSALFLPFKNLGLLILDEEHDASFKQFDPSPRYHARDAALYLAAMQKASIILGTATPSIETYYQAMSGKYGYVSLKERFGGVQVPEVEIIDMKEESREKKLKLHFSSTLTQALENTINEKNQVILFQNRRGYSPMVLCKSCGFVQRCIQCDVSLTLHKFTQKMHCHYCGYKAEIPKICPVCMNPHIIDQGLGTEKIEEELQSLYPELRIGRMDQDSVKGKNGHWKILSELEDNKLDVLIGTQMVSKGLDFGNIQLIGVMNADLLLNFPDFRAFERGFQTLTQVGGRAGRRKKRGKLLIQTYTPLHPILHFIKNHDYDGLYRAEIAERERFGYPPFTRLIRIQCRNTEIHKLQAFTYALSIPLKQRFGEMILGPEEALIPRVRNYYIQEFLLKFPRNTFSPQAIKQALIQILQEIGSKKEFKSTSVNLDVDPA